MDFEVIEQCCIRTWPDLARSKSNLRNHVHLPGGKKFLFVVQRRHELLRGHYFWAGIFYDVTKHAEKLHRLPTPGWYLLAATSFEEDISERPGLL